MLARGHVDKGPNRGPEELGALARSKRVRLLHSGLTPSSIKARPNWDTLGLLCQSLDVLGI